MQSVSDIMFRTDSSDYRANLLQDNFTTQAPGRSYESSQSGLYASRLVATATISTANNQSQDDASVSFASPEVVELNFAKIVLVGGFLAVVIAFALAGNILVIIAILTDHNLRRTGNYFLISLAVADAMVAVVVMSFAVVNDLLGRWIFGSIFCNIWLSSDVMCCTASILSLCAVSLDRYVNVGSPLHYSRMVTHRRCLVAVVVIWTMSTLLSFLPIHFGWHRLGIDSDPVADTHATHGNVSYSNFTGIDKSNDLASDPIPQCKMELNPWYAVVSSSISFYIPCLVMILIYCKLYRFAREHVKSIRQSQQLHASCFDGRTNKSCEDSLTFAENNYGAEGLSMKATRASDNGSNICAIDRLNSAEFKANGVNTAESCAVENKPAISSPGKLLSISFSREREGSIAGVGRRPSDIGDNSLQLTRKATPTRRKLSLDAVKSFRVSSDHKAALTVGIIMGVFLLCWMPFFAINIIGSFCKECIPEVVFTVFSWFGYANSTMNPVIYSVFNHDFRRAFKRILCRRSCRSWRWPGGSDGFGNGGNRRHSGAKVRRRVGAASNGGASFPLPAASNCYIQIQTASSSLSNTLRTVHGDAASAIC